MTTLLGQHPHVPCKGLYLEEEEIGPLADQRLDVAKQFQHHRTMDA